MRLNLCPYIIYTWGTKTAYRKVEGTMAMKIVGIILILVGCYSLYEAQQAVNQGRISPFEGETADPVIKRGDPDFNKQVATRRVGGGTLIVLGIGCLFIKRKDG